MQCDICHKNEASLHFKEVVQDKVVSLNLCRECADAQGVTKSLQSELELAELIKALSDHSQPEAPAAAGTRSKTESRPATTACSQCGTTLDDLRKSGRLGCPACYAAFAAELRPILVEAHRGLTHKGKVPGTAGTPPPTPERAQDAVTLARLDEELARAVAAEAYERAAALRDQVSKLRQKLDGVRATHEPVS